MHFRSLKSGLLWPVCQQVTFDSEVLSATPNVRQVPLCKSAAVRVVDALPRHGKDAFVGEQELLNGAFGGRMTAKRGVAFELRSVEGADPALSECQHGAAGHGVGKRTHMVVSRPQQLLGGVESERRDGCGGLVRSRRRQLSYG